MSNVVCFTDVGILLVVAIGVALGVFLGGALLSVVSLVLKRFLIIFLYNNKTTSYYSVLSVLL